MSELIWFGWKMVLKAGTAYAITWAALAFFPKRLRIGAVESLWLRTLSWVCVAGIIIMIIAATGSVLQEVRCGGPHVSIR